MPKAVIDQAIVLVSGSISDWDSSALLGCGIILGESDEAVPVAGVRQYHDDTAAGD